MPSERNAHLQFMTNPRPPIEKVLENDALILQDGRFGAWKLLYVDSRYPEALLGKRRMAYDVEVWHYTAATVENLCLAALGRRIIILPAECHESRYSDLLDYMGGRIDRFPSKD